MKSVLLDGERLTLEDLEAIADRHAPVALAPAAATAVDAARAVVDAKASGDVPVYGINTGFGSLAEVKI
ncbi:MAG TPA: aromatic amino acid lyase, partial [Vicinamibacterales bacterium]|nr:aromatic amino acid lyase [Vicinamibacterales bacterium]